ncbi:MAG: ATP-dependent DNA helicase PcrA [Acidobacteria bacterium]|nr:MAG: ATP-dependent DNA helicase PcrA [Acidobacteriota bacterium]
MPEDPVPALLEGLNPVQREAVMHGEGPILVVAGAGSGKTRVLTHRIAYLIQEFGADPFSILAITFTNRAASEMVARVSGLLGHPLSPAMWVRTFHSACVRILRREAEALGYRQGFSIYDDSDSERLVAACLKELGYESRQFTPRGIKSKISHLKNRMVTSAEFAESAKGPSDEVTAAVFERYNERLIEASAMDFDDLLLKTVELFKAHPGILEHYRARFAHVLVDEFQDTNLVQWEMVRMIGGEHGNIFCVGDSDQSIYRFRGADTGNMASFERDIAGTRVVMLEQNYRSTTTILNAANAVIANNSARRHKNLWSELGEGEPVTVFVASDERAEAGYVADEIARLVDGGDARFGEVAVFYRTNAQSRSIEEALAAAAIPYRVVGGTRFYDRREIRDALAYLRLIANPADSVSLRRIVNVPRRGIGDTTVVRLTEYATEAGMSLFDAMRSASSCPALAARSAKKAEEFAELLMGMRDGLDDLTGVAGILDAVLEQTGYRADLEEQESIEATGRLENLAELTGVAADFDAAWDAGMVEVEPEVEPTGGGLTVNARRLAGFLEQVGLVADVDALADPESSVTLMTLHNAKGLEFPVVFVTGMEDGIFPHSRSMADREELEEERRICYVGITRAGERLYLTRAWERNLFGTYGSNPPSRFLSEIPSELTREIGTDPGRWSESVSGVRTSRSAISRAPQGGPDRIARKPERAAPISLSLGDDVVHNKWGEGVVIGLEGEGDDAQALVRFPSVGEKRLLLAWAPLAKV